MSISDTPEDDLEVLYTRPDGQVFGVQDNGDGEYQSVVPEDLAEAGEGFCHCSADDARKYLRELIAREPS